MTTRARSSRKTIRRIADGALPRARQLTEAVTRDYGDGLWFTWPRHLKTYNALIRELIGNGIELAPSPISPIARHVGSTEPESSSKAKLSEILSASRGIVEELQSYSLESQPASGQMGRQEALPIVDRIMDRFHVAAKMLADPPSERKTRTVRTEADVQRLLRALLAVQFDDVRREEPVPSFAGHSARTDLLLKGTGIFVEVKVVRSVSAGRSIGDELLVDIDRYQGHRECRVLICFVYDPHGHLKNPRGLEADLEKKGKRESLQVKVMVRP